MRSQRRQRLRIVKCVTESDGKLGSVGIVGAIVDILVLCVTDSAGDVWAGSYIYAWAVALAGSRYRMLATVIS